MPEEQWFENNVLYDSRFRSVNVVHSTCPNIDDSELDYAAIPEFGFNMITSFFDFNSSNNQHTLTNDDRLNWVGEVGEYSNLHYTTPLNLKENRTYKIEIINLI